MIVTWPSATSGPRISETLLRKACYVWKSQGRLSPSRLPADIPPLSPSIRSSPICVSPASSQDTLHPSQHLPCFGRNSVPLSLYADGLPTVRLREAALTGDPDHFSLHSSLCSTEKGPVWPRPSSVPSSSFPFPVAFRAPPRTHPALKLISAEALWSPWSPGGSFFGRGHLHRVPPYPPPQAVMPGGALISLPSSRHPKPTVPAWTLPARGSSSISSSTWTNHALFPHPLQTHLSAPHLRIKNLGVSLNTSFSLTSST